MTEFVGEAEDHESAEPIMAHIAHEKHGYLRVPALRFGDQVVYDGDIFLGTVEQIKAAEAAAQTVDLDHHSVVPLEQLPREILAAITPSRAWPGRRVYYRIDADEFDPAEARLITDAIDLWRATDLFDFKPERNRTVGYIDFKKSKGFGSYLGLMPGTNGKQPLHLGALHKEGRSDEETIGKIAHEIGHALGLTHEHQRRDAQSYVDILWDNIQRKYLDQYATQVEGLRVGAYDYDSIMHYGSTTPDAKPKTASDGNIEKDANNEVVRLPVLQPRDANATLGQRQHLALSDINAAAALYGEGVAWIEVIVSDEPPAGADAFLGIGGREFRLKRRVGAPDTGGYIFGTSEPRKPPESPRSPPRGNTNVENPGANDPRLPPMSTAHVLGQPVYLRLETRGDTWTVRNAKVTAEVLEQHGDAHPWKVFPDFVYQLREGQAGATLGPSSGLKVHLARKAAGAVMPDRHSISRIEGEVRADSSASNVRVYLGLAGREFPMERQGAHKLHIDQTFSGESKLTETDLLEFPMYVHAEAGSDVQLRAGAESVIRVTLGSGDKEIGLVPTADPLHLSSANGMHCCLKYANAPIEHTYPSAGGGEPRQPERVAAHARGIAVTACVPDGLHGEVYLGLGGREFKLDFVDGPVSGVLHCDLARPSPKLSLLEIDTYPTYLRAEGTSDCKLTSAYVTVPLEDRQGATLYRGRWLNQGVMWSYPSRLQETPLDPDKPGELRTNPEMAVNFGTVMNGLVLGAGAGRCCALVRMRPPLVEVKFVLDTTGSMAGLIGAAKKTIRTITAELAGGQPRPEIRVGLLGYRDHGETEEYLTLPFALTADLEAVYKNLHEKFQAQGGGDEREAVLPALLEAVAGTDARPSDWTKSPDVYRTIFLVGDAPPHIEGTGDDDLTRLAGDSRYRKMKREAADMDIQINTVQCGNSPATQPIWKKIAEEGKGRYWQIAQHGDGFHLTILDTMREHAARIGIRYD